jgi:hypothetical protein
MEPLAKREPANGTPSTKRATGVGLPAKQRSRVTNGALFGATIRDGRSGWSRRLGDLLSLHIADLGGQDVVSNAERSLIRRIATISVELEWIEQSFKSSRKGPTTEQLDLYLRGSNNLRRLLEAIGLERRARDVTPTLEDIAEEIEAERNAAEQAQQRDDIGRSDAAGATDATS